MKKLINFLCKYLDKPKYRGLLLLPFTIVVILSFGIMWYRYTYLNITSTEIYLWLFIIAGFLLVFSTILIYCIDKHNDNIKYS